MSRTARRAEKPRRAPMRPPVAVPPPDGWTPMEAAEALCPREARLYRQGGPALDAAAGVDEDDEWALGGEADLWLSGLVLAAVAKRPELVLTGRDVALDVRAERYRLPRDVLLAALRGSPPDRYSHHEIRVRLWFDFGIADVQYWPAKLHAADPSFINLIEVRVEVSIVADAEAEPQARRGLRGAGIDAPAKPTWTEDGCRIWFQRRVASHPKGEPSPTERDCLAAAHADFDGHIPRDKFRAIRGGETPASWRRPGPRGPRRPRD